MSVTVVTRALSWGCWAGLITNWNCFAFLFFASPFHFCFYNARLNGLRQSSRTNEEYEMEKKHNLSMTYEKEKEKNVRGRGKIDLQLSYLKRERDCE